MTYEQWDKISPINGVDAIDLIGQEQMDNDDIFLLFKDEKNNIVSIESVATIKSAYGLAGESLEEIAQSYIAWREPSLDEEKIKKIALINAECRKAIESGFWYDGKFFKSAVDPDQANISLAGLQFIMDNTTTISWETADNGDTIILDATTFPAFASAFGTHKMEQQKKVAQLKKAITLATSFDELEAIVW